MGVGAFRNQRWAQSHGPRIDKGTPGKKRRRDATKPSAQGDDGTVLSGNEDYSAGTDRCSSSSDPRAD